MDRMHVDMKVPLGQPHAQIDVTTAIPKELSLQLVFKCIYLSVFIQYCAYKSYCFPQVYPRMANMDLQIFPLGIFAGFDDHFLKQMDFHIPNRIEHHASQVPTPST